MVYLLLQNKTFEVSDNILKISTYFDDIAKNRESEVEPIVLINATKKVFEIFFRWFTLLNDYIRYETESTVIFKPEFFEEFDSTELIEIFNFGFHNQIQLLCETVAYVLGLRNIELKNLHISLKIMILKNMNEFDFQKQSTDLKNLVHIRPKVIPYIPFHNNCQDETCTEIPYGTKQLVNKRLMYMFEKNGDEINHFIYAINDSNKIIHAVLPNTVKNISKAFSFCQHLKTVELSEGVTIGNQAFFCCERLESIEIPARCVVRKHAFKNCVSLKTVKVHPTVTIEQRAFESCKKLNLIHGDRLVSVSTDTENFIIPDSIEFIDDLAFEDCEFLTTLQVPNSVMRIGELAFSFCKKLQHIEIPSHTIIENNAFIGCFDLTFIHDNKLFSVNRDLTSFEIPRDITEIENCAFTSSNVNEIFIPKNVKIIRNAAFHGCEYLTKVVFEDAGCFENAVCLESSVFSSCGNLEFIELLGITTLEDEVFEYCSKLETVKIPNVKKIGNRVFNECFNLRTVEMNSVETIGSEAFKACEELKTTLPDSLKYIGDFAFENSGEIRLSRNIEKIGAYAFYGSKIKVLRLSSSIVDVGNCAFDEIDTLETASANCSIELLIKSGPVGGKFSTYRIEVMSDEEMFEDEAYDEKSDDSDNSCFTCSNIMKEDSESSDDLD